MLLWFQLDFSDDVVRIIQTAINSDGGHPENRKANSMVKSFFIRVRAQRCFPYVLIAVRQRNMSKTIPTEISLNVSYFSKWTESSRGLKWRSPGSGKGKTSLPSECIALHLGHRSYFERMIKCAVFYCFEQAVTVTEDIIDCLQIILTV